MSDELSSTEAPAPALLEPGSVELAASIVVPPEDAETALARRQSEFRALVFAWEPRLLSYAQRLLKSRPDAEDATQDALLAAWLKNDLIAECGREPTRILCYMIRVVFRKAMNMQRERSRWLKALARLSELVGLRTQRPAALLDTVIARAALEFTQGVLDEMAPEYAAAFIEVVLRGGRPADVAKTLGANVNTLKAHASKAKKEVLSRLVAAGHLSDTEVAREKKEDTP